MTISSTNIVDDNFKVINKITGGRNESDTVVTLNKLKGFTNESKISVANLYYEVKGTGKVDLYFNEIDEEETLITMTGIDNYGLKPNEKKFKGEGNLLITSDANVDSFKLMLECHKETGFN